MLKYLFIKYKSYFELLILFVLIYAGIYNSNFYLVALGINLFTVTFRSYKKAFAQLFFLLPFSMIYKFPGSTSFFTYGMLVLSARCLIHFINKRNAGIILFLSLLTIYFVLGIRESFSSVYRVVCGILCLIAFVKNTKLADIKEIVISSSLGILFASYMGLSKTSNPQITRFFKGLNREWMDGEATYRFSGLMPDPNYYSVAVIVTLFMLLRLIQAKAINKFWGSGLIICLVFFGFKSYSRLYYIAVGIFILYYLYVMYKNTRYKFVSLCVFVISSIVGWGYIITSSFYSKMLVRFQEEDITNGRASIFKNYMQAFADNPSILLYGVGLDGPLVRWIGAHNTYVEIVYFVGLAGSTIFMILIYKIFQMRGHLSHDWNNYILLFTFLIMIASLGFFTHSDLYFYLMFIWATLYYSFNDLASLSSLNH